MELELELEETPLSGYEQVHETTAVQEETMEMIVPDACPDILRIVDTEARAELGSRESQEGRAEVSGTVRGGILYLPEGEEGPRKLELTIPFRCTVEHPAIHSGYRVVALPRVVGVETRSLNPRKVLTRVEVAVEAEIFAPNQRRAAGGAVCPPEEGVEQLRSEEGWYGPVCVTEKPFPFADSVDLPSSRPAAEVLRHRLTSVCSESKVIGSKLIFKGTAALHLLYRTADGQLCTADFELPISQILEVPEAGEGCDPTVTVAVLTSSCALEPGSEGRSVRVELELLAQAVLRAQRPLTLLTDLYSTVWESETEGEELPLEELVDQGVRRETVRELLETGVEAGTVCDAWATLGHVNQSREGKQLWLEVEVTAAVLFRTEEGALESVSRHFTVRCPLDAPEGCLCSWRCELPEGVQASPAGGGLEVRFPVDYHFLTRRVRRPRVITAARLDQEKPREREGQPSIVLRLAGRGERLWDVAKHYATTEGDICQANELEGGHLPEGQLLLIPRKRRVEG